MPAGQGKQLIRCGQGTRQCPLRLAAAIEIARHPGGKPGTQRCHRRLQIGPDRHRHFCGTRRCRCAHVGGKIDQGPVGLVADRGNDRDPRRGNGADNRFIVEAPKVFKAAAAACDDQHVGAGQGAGWR